VKSGCISGQNVIQPDIQYIPIHYTNCLHANGVSDRAAVAAPVTVT